MDSLSRLDCKSFIIASTRKQLESEKKLEDYRRLSRSFIRGSTIRSPGSRPRHIQSCRFPAPCKHHSGPPWAGFAPCKTGDCHCHSKHNRTTVSPEYIREIGMLRTAVAAEDAASITVSEDKQLADINVGWLNIEELLDRIHLANQSFPWP